MARFSRFPILIAALLLGFLASLSAAESAERRPGSKLYDNGDGWAVMRDAGKRVCLGVIIFDERSVIISSIVYEGRMTYTLAFSDRTHPPRSMTYDYEIRNEGAFRLSVMGRGYPQSGGGSGYVLIGPLGWRELSAVMGSRSLYVETSGIGEGRYDMSTKRTAFGRVSDCLRENAKKKSPPPAPSKPRRMN
jgi:hypothetical protein